MSGVSFPDMVDAIPQVREALASLDTSTPYTVTEQWHRKTITGNLDHRYGNHKCRDRH